MPCNSSGGLVLLYHETKENKMETLIFRGVITLYVLESEAGDGRGCASLGEVWK